MYVRYGGKFVAISSIRATESRGVTRVFLLNQSDLTAPRTVSFQG